MRFVCTQNMISDDTLSQFQQIKLADSIYNSNWYDADPSVKKYVLLALMRSQSPIYFTASGFATISRLTLIFVSLNQILFEYISIEFLFILDYSNYNILLHLFKRDVCFKLITRSLKLQLFYMKYISKFWLKICITPFSHVYNFQEHNYSQHTYILELKYVSICNSTILQLNLYTTFFALLIF